MVGSARVGVGVGVQWRGAAVELVVGVGEEVGSLVGLRVGVAVGGTGVGVGSIVTARTTGSEGELLASTACISNWVFKSM
jgi:hypothetical protein